jgi:hypothetical protein
MGKMRCSTPRCLSLLNITIIARTSFDFITVSKTLEEADKLVLGMSIEKYGDKLFMFHLVWVVYGVIEMPERVCTTMDDEQYKSTKTRLIEDN